MTALENLQHAISILDASELDTFTSILFDMASKVVCDKMTVSEAQEFSILEALSEFASCDLTSILGSSSEQSSSPSLLEQDS